MGNETRRVLDLLAQGKVTADEAEQLLAAVGQPQETAAGELPPAEASGAPATAKPQPKWLRVVVFKTRNIVDETLNGAAPPKKEVNIRIPLALARAGLKLGAVVPGLAGDRVNRHLHERGIDLSKIDPAHIEDVMKEIGDMTVDVDDGKHQVRIFCE